ncbi:hypothetical protein Ddye_018886 [Dipteronia dyeriana]|uniref:Uncharacterized protein n=1 Tax=Dipteronia dyeriana TaxID=168575 RepID=A0AAD9TWX5_9ROSI|nr:hypothetical protein Ddye_018886 [Dipteronia dyeriana]
MDPDRNKNNEFQLLQTVNNIARAAYTEFAQRAFERIENFLGMISADELVLNIFRQTPQGKRVEFSIASSVIPISPSELCCILFDTAAWRPLWLQIVHEARSFFPTADLQRLSESFGEGYSHFPAEFLRCSGEWSCKSSFLRYQKQIQEDIWTITDVSDDYLDVLNPEAELEYRRGPSGIIAREMDEECCEPSWRSLGVVAFVCTVCCFLLFPGFMQKLLELYACMEMEFFQTISAEPNEKEFSIVIDEEMRILTDLILDKSPNLIVIASIYVPAAPLLVHEFLVQKA